MSSYRIDGLDSSSGMSTLTVIPSGSYPLIYTQSNNTLQQTPNDQLVQTTSIVTFDSVEAKNSLKGAYIATGVTDLGGNDTFNGNDITAVRFFGALHATGVTDLAGFNTINGNDITAITFIGALQGNADTATTATTAITATTATTAVTATTATTANNVAISNTTVNATFYPIFVSGAGSQAVFGHGGGTPFSFNPSTNTLTATTFSGNLTGNAGTATLASTATNISGGAVGNIPYQTGTSATTFLTNGASGSLLTSNGVGFAPTYTTPYSYTASLSCGGASATSNSVTLSVVTGTPLNVITRILTSVSTQHFNVLSGFSLDTSNNRFTCTSSGSYYVQVSLNISTTSAWDIFTDFYLNGANLNSNSFLYSRNRSTSATTSGVSVRHGFNFNFTAGQSFDFRMNLATGTTTMTGNLQNGSSITVTRIPF